MGSFHSKAQTNFAPPFVRWYSLCSFKNGVLFEVLIESVVSAIVDLQDTKSTFLSQIDQIQPAISCLQKPSRCWE